LPVATLPPPTTSTRRPAKSRKAGNSRRAITSSFSRTPRPV
jgi:hypothetical protein